MPLTQSHDQWQQVMFSFFLEITFYFKCQNGSISVWGWCFLIGVVVGVFLVGWVFLCVCGP